MSSHGPHPRISDAGLADECERCHQCDPCECGGSDDCDVCNQKRRDEDGPTDDETYNRVGVEGGIAYDTTADEPGSLGENDWRL